VEIVNSLGKYLKAFRIESFVLILSEKWLTIDIWELRQYLLC
jgi:hypothetical protein